MSTLITFPFLTPSAGARFGRCVTTFMVARWDGEEWSRVGNA